MYAEKVVFFPEIKQVKKFLSLTRSHSQRIRTYIFCFKKHTHTQTKRKKLKKLAGCKF